MPDSRPHIHLDKGRYIDVYAASGIKVGTPLTIQNTSPKPTRLAISANEPSIDTQAYTPLMDDVYKVCYISAGESGCWAWTGFDTPLNVQEDT